MAITNVDFVVRQHSTYGAQCLNVFYYRKTGAHAAGDAANLASAFDATVSLAIANMSNNQVNLGLVVAENLVDLSDYASRETNETLGAIVSTSPGPRFLAYSFRMNRSTRQGRNGYKRFVGVSEELIAGESTNTSGALTAAVAAMITALAAEISAGGATFAPMIPRRVLTVMPDQTERYILTDLLPPSSVEFRGLTTQNTRKQ